MRNINISELGKALNDELTLYSEEVIDKVNVASQEAVEDLVKKTKLTAPVGKGKKRGRFRRSIAWKCTRKTPRGNTYTWYVKGKDARLTHLIVHGHATKDGGRTKANPFLKNALAEVEQSFLQKIKEVIGNG